ncbi:MAG: NUDIX hydrolase [Cytophagaceae bacterium]
MSKGKYLETLSIDCVIFGFDEGELKILLIKRAGEPSKGKWALPGGFVGKYEDLEESAKRILEELTGLKDIYMEQFHTFGDVNRFPLRRVVSIAYYALIKIDAYNLKAAANAEEVKWFPMSEVPSLAFDHSNILQAGFARLKQNVRHYPIGFELLPEKFTLTQLQTLYESVLSMPLDKRNFRKKILSMDLIVKLNESQTGVAHRAARFFKFDKKRYQELKSKGFVFEI